MALNKTTHLLEEAINSNADAFACIFEGHSALVPCFPASKSKEYIIHIIYAFDLCRGPKGFDTITEQQLEHEDSQQRGSLHFAFANNAYKSVEGTLAVLNKKRDYILNLLKRKDQHQISPLLYAARYDCVDVFRAVIDRLGKKQVTIGQDIIDTAVEHQSRRTFGYLYEQGFVPRNTRDDKRVALDMAIEVGAVEVCKDVGVLKEALWDGKLLQHAVYSKSALAVHWLIDEGANVMVPTLRRASRDGSRSADPRANGPTSDTGSTTLLHMAVQSGCLWIVKLILLSGSSANLFDYKQHSPAHLAAELGHVDILHLLCDYGASLACSDRENRSPLHLAALRDHIDAVKVLLERRANADSEDCYRRTPPCYALNKETDVSLKDAERITHVPLNARYSAPL
ncbi:hypothetical protein MMC10_011076 [Thelotrema lepadinum]|nr:hypothetical protein [Thelotrema lepadinum]